MHRVVVTAVLAMAAVQAQDFTCGIGVYPGDPKQNWSPTLEAGGKELRNLALHRPAYHSSSYDYNLTAQLVTDGIKSSGLPRHIVVTSSREGVLPKNEREHILDNNWVTGADLRGKSVWLQVEIAGGAGAPAIDGLQVEGSIRALEPDNQEVTVTVSGSDDGKSWQELGHSAQMVRPTGELHPRIAFRTAARQRFYRVQFDNGRPLDWQIGELQFLNKGAQVHVGGPYEFSSAWMSAGSGEEWVYVDLGTKSQIERVAMSWVRRAAEGSLQVSDDAREWKSIHALDSDEIKLATPVEARYVRLLLTKAADPQGYVLSELEVWGRGGLTVRPKPAAGATDHVSVNGRTALALSGGAWKLQRDSLVKAAGAVLSQLGYDDREWVAATVPGTVLATYYNAGAVPNPDYGDNQLMISDSFFYADFWYRNEFAPPVRPKPGERVWLNFAGVNWKAEVFLNGERLGKIDGGFTGAKFDVTGKLPEGRKSALAVRIVKNATPGSIKEKTFDNPDKNGGALGADNPTFHASIGWDWIPTIRGRDTGIWNDVSLSVTGGVTIETSHVDTTLPLPDVSRAEVKIDVTLRNRDPKAVTGTLRGRFGEETFAIPVSLAPAATKSVSHTLTLSNPKLWWPAGYGEANLYPVELKFENSDAQTFEAGVRQFTYSEEGGALRMWINGRRFIPRGGNWGFGESMLRYRGREYEAAMRYHRDMHFNMVRNWVGQIGEDAFYEAADHNGIVIMQDFWLANPWDGPEPDNNQMFMANVKDTLLRIRNHASIGLYCGRNEGYPLKPLDDSIRAALKELHPSIQYVPSSADDGVSGHGPYQAMSPEYYFTNRATTKFHSELGMPNIVTMDSLKAMMPEEAMWPQGRMWGIHDFSLNGAQGGASFRARIEKSYGGAKNVEEWVSLAQFVNYEGYRAMFEAQSKNRMGLLIWMSHPTWPSMVWQTYDYYLEPTAGYFGAKKASEPLHIQWNPSTDQVEVVNYSAGNVEQLVATAEVLNLDGAVKWQARVGLASKEDSVFTGLKMTWPADVSAVHFLRLKLMTINGRTVSENFYWRGREAGNYTALRELPKVKLESSTHVEQQAGRWILVTELRNNSTAPALMVRLKAVREKSGDRILPALYSDNYVSLMPGEARSIRTEVEHADTRGERPAMVVEGFNLQAGAVN